MNPAFSLFFVMKRARNHSNTAANEIDSTGKMISWTGNS